MYTYSELLVNINAHISFCSCFILLSRLQCCGLKVGESPLPVVPQPLEGCGSLGYRDKKGASETVKDTLSPLFSLSDSPGPPDIMLAHRRTPSINGQATLNMENGLNHSKSSAGAKNASIRDKISQWEGKNESVTLNATQKEVETVRKKEPKVSEVQRTDSKRFVSWDRQDSGKENVGKPVDLSPTSKDKEVIPERSCCSSKPTEPQDKKTVLTHVKKLEKATKEVPSRPSLAFPGNYFSPPSKEELDEMEKKTSEPIFGIFDKAQPGRFQRKRQGDSENVYCEPGAPSINPLPKPQRTFQHPTSSTATTSGSFSRKAKRNLPPLPSVPPPPLPSCPPPGVCRRPWADKPRDSNNR